MTNLPDSETFRDATFTKEERDSLEQAARLLRALAVTMPAADKHAETVQNVVDLWDMNDATETTFQHAKNEA